MAPNSLVTPFVDRPNTASNTFANSSLASSNQPAFFASLNSIQYDQWMEMLNLHLSTPKSEPITAKPISHIEGTRFSVLSSFTTNASNIWVIDSGALTHICHVKDLFTTMVVLTILQLSFQHLHESV